MSHTRADASDSVLTGCSDWPHRLRHRKGYTLEGGGLSSIQAGTSALGLVATRVPKMMKAPAISIGDDAIPCYSAVLCKETRVRKGRTTKKSWRLVTCLLQTHHIPSCQQCSMHKWCSLRLQMPAQRLQMAEALQPRIHEASAAKVSPGILGSRRRLSR